MKAYRSFFIPLLLLVVWILSGCEMLGLSYDSSDTSDDADYIGTWLGYDGSVYQQIVITDSSFTTKFSYNSGMYPIEYAEKGTYTVSGDQFNINITYTWNIDYDDADSDGYVDESEWSPDSYSFTVTYSVSNDTLTVTMGTDTLTYTRQ